MKRGDDASVIGVRRRDVLVGAGAAVLLGAPAARSQSGPRVGLPETLYEDSSTLHNAVIAGHFRGAAAGTGIDVVADSATVIAGLRQKRFAVGQVLALDLMRDAAQGGEPLISIALLNRMPLYCYGRRPKGRTIAVPADVAQADAYLSLDLARNGTDPARVKRIPVARWLEALEQILDKKVDAAVLTLGKVGLIGAVFRKKGANDERMGFSRRPLDVSSAPFPGLCFATTRALSEAEPALMVDWLRGMLTSIREQVGELSPSEPVVERLKRVKTTARSDVLYLMQELQSGAAMLALFTGGGRERLLRHDPARWKDGAALLTKAGVVDIRAAADALYTDRFIEEASRT